MHILITDVFTVAVLLRTLALERHEFDSKCRWMVHTAVLWLIAVRRSEPPGSGVGRPSLCKISRSGWSIFSWTVSTVLLRLGFISVLMFLFFCCVQREFRATSLRSYQVVVVDFLSHSVCMDVRMPLTVHLGNVNMLLLLQYKKLRRCRGTAWRATNAKYCTWKGLQ